MHDKHFISALSVPGLGTVERRCDQVSPAIPVKDQSLSAGQHAAAKADFTAAQRREAVVGGKTRAGETLGQESGEGLRRKLTSRTAEAWVTSVQRGSGLKAEMITWSDRK